MRAIPFPPYPSIPSPATWLKDGLASAPQLRSDVLNAVLLLTQPPLFCGAQTGVPSTFTYASSSGLFTSTATYANGQQLVLSALTGCSAFTAGTAYFVQNSGTTPGTFQLATTGTGSPVTGGTSGSGTAQQTQVLSSSTSAWTPLNLDTELTDAWQSHLTTTNPPYSYAMLPGIYLAECSFPANYTGGGGTVSAGITAQEGTALPITIGGARAPNSGTSGRYPAVTAVKLLQFSVTGTQGGAANNYAGPVVYQDSGASFQPLMTATRYPTFTLEWVAGLTSNPALAVPDLDAWPVAPDILSRSFLNKNVRDAITFLAARPVVEAVYAAGTFSLASQSSLPAVGTTVPLDTVHIDNRVTTAQAQFSTSTSAWTCLYPGVYDIYGQMSAAAATTSLAVAAGITVQSVNYNSGAAFTVWGTPQTAATSTSAVSSALTRRRLRLGYGDTLKLAAWQASSASAAATIPGGTWKPRLITVWRAA